MLNTLIASIYIPFAIITFSILVQVLLRNLRHKDNYLFMLLCILVICWDAVDIIGCFFVLELKFELVFVGLIPPVLLLFVLDFYRVSLGRMQKFTPAIFLVPTINVIMVLSAKYHTLLDAKFDGTSLAPLQEAAVGWGPWFWVHTTHSYILSIAIIAIILIQHFRLPKFYRLPSNLMAIGIAVTLAANVTTLLHIFTPAFDPTLIGTSLALIFFNYAIINNDSSNFVRYSHSKVFDYLDLFIIITDESDRVVYLNRPASVWLRSLGIATNSTLNYIVDSITNMGVDRSESENEKGSDFYFPSDPLPYVLNLYVQKMVDTNGEYIGSVAIFTDVTQNRLLLNRLEQKAGMDSLTGIANRMAYEGARNRLDSPEHLPLSVIICDVNDLKTVNDNLGHQYGDMMLQVVSEILETVCPRPGFLARIGGDEFIYLLSRTDEADAAAFIDKVRAELSRRTDLPFTLSVAMGAAAKLSPEEKIGDVIDLADSRMYENKKAIKAQKQESEKPQKQEAEKADY